MQGHDNPGNLNDIRASQLMESGRYAEAEILFRIALQEMTSNILSQPTCVSVTLNKLADCLLAQNKVDEGLSVNLYALRILDSLDYPNGLVDKPDYPTVVNNSNVARECIAKLYEALGRKNEVLDCRKKGYRICANEKCVKRRFDSLSRCTECACVYYCNAECQRTDWFDRHKHFCHILRDPKEENNTRSFSSTVFSTDIALIPIISLVVICVWYLIKNKK